MNILLISSGNYDYDGRLRELMAVFSSLGTLSAFTAGSVPCHARHYIYKTPARFDLENFPPEKLARYQKNRLLWRWCRTADYLCFIKRAISLAKQQGGIDLLVLDNQKAALPGMLIKKLFRPRSVLQDCRECYLKEEMRTVLEKQMCRFEGFSIRRANIIVAANQERADFMRRYYHLKETPLVFENLRQLQYSSDFDPSQLPRELVRLLEKNEFRVLATAGCDCSRLNDVLTENFHRTGAQCRLLLAGSSGAEDISTIEEIIRRQKLDRVTILGRVDQNTLKYLVQHSHVGIVSYHQKDLNNRFCASGKLFEFIYEGIPVVTTTNPPLKRLCAAGVGVADDTFADGINEVRTHYDAYRKSASAYAADHTVEQNRLDFAAQLSHCLSIQNSD